MAGGYEIERRSRARGRVEHVAVVELTADECEATAHAFGPGDGVYDEMLAAAAEIRRRDSGDDDDDEGGSDGS